MTGLRVNAVWSGSYPEEKDRVELPERCPRLAGGREEGNPLSHSEDSAECEDVEKQKRVGVEAKVERATARLGVGNDWPATVGMGAIGVVMPRIGARWWQ